MAERYKQKRTTIKGNLTRFTTYFATVKDKPIQEIDFLELQRRLDSATSLLNEFERTQEQIEFEDANFEDNTDTHFTERESFENSFYKITASVERFITSNNSTKDNEEFASAPSERFNNNPNNNQTSLAHISLPKLNIPKFNGEYDQWLFFKDTFNSLIHSNTAIANVDKFQFLRLSLVDTARDTIESLEISDNNYPIAWKLLNDRFENKQILVNNHIRNLFNIPSIAKENKEGLKLILNGMEKHLRALQALKLPTEHWDALVIHLITSKLDNVTLREWESTKHAGELPTRAEFTDFLYERCRILDSLDSSSTKANKPYTHSKSKTLAITSNSKCTYCDNANHNIYQCDNFKSFDPQGRLNHAKRLKLCINCLVTGHTTRQCKSSGCRKCGKQHHSLLHFNNQPGQANSNTANITPSNESIAQRQTGAATPSAPVTLAICNPVQSLPYVIISTAVVTVFDQNNIPHKCRLVLDSASQSNIITERLCKLLHLQRQKCNTSISGVALSNSSVHQQTIVRIQSNVNSFAFQLHCFILPKITGDIPSIPLSQYSLQIPENVTMADPNFDKMAPVDLLLGADTFWALMSVGQIKLGSGINDPILQKTKLGWIIAGAIKHTQHYKPMCHFSSTDPEQDFNSQLDAQLRKFWEIENYKFDKFSSEKDVMIESHYKDNTYLNNNGRFIVKMPMKVSENALGHSKHMALERFLALERKLQKHSSVAQQYSNFIDEYLALGHMSLASNQEDESGFYLPHHCVFKDTSITTKLRVVFDGSAKTSSGHSLNNILMVGPTIQQELFHIIIRFRKHNVVISGDIQKMYRQVLLHPDQRNLQKILWRSKPTDEIKTYCLNTVTYGLAPSAFLAIRSLHEVAYRHIEDHPFVAETILKDFYVDDLLTGCDTIYDAKMLKTEITELLNKHGFPLHKWISNKREIQVEGLNPLLDFGEASESRTLGLIWNSCSDVLQYSIRKPSTPEKLTKRSILSNIAQIFDPLGLLAPVTITAKILIQQLWKLKITWDESVPQDVHTIWSNYRSQLMLLNSLTIPRQVVVPCSSSFELHGFSDASESAYGACVYVRCLERNQTYTARILCAKTRVAPLKQATIPRLELCGALLLAELMQKVQHSIEVNFDHLFYWCDSKIVLAWINTCPSRLKVFVANRVSQIQDLSDRKSWHYINTSQNPADLLSRGVSPSTFISSDLWFNGPNWLALPEPEWPTYLTIKETTDHTEFRTLIVTEEPNELVNTISRFSSLTRLKRTFAYVLRFIQNAKSSSTRNTGPLTTNELENALTHIIRLDQITEFPQDYHALSKSYHLPSNSKLLSLNPFIDKNNVIRVGGRIQHTTYHFDKKHPVVLHSGTHLANLIGNYEHLRLLHAGPQALLASIREKYWPIGGRSFARKIVHNCLTCFKTNPKGEKYIMGNLPESRLTPTRPFLISGVDYAGPFALKDRKTRNYKVTKAYIALFICFSTKAIHLELVSDLTTDCFIAALRRFFARRGMCAKLYSDNGTNFVGANNELKKFLRDQGAGVAEVLSRDNVEWSFIPPRAPHFGGLWEAGVKLVKSHLKRVVSNTPFNFEEFCTIITQIEACVNSRPLCLISNNPNDLSVLTPGHFLIGEPLTSLPDPDWSGVKENRLSRYQRVQQMIQHFWSRWHKEYIATMQQRPKWRQTSQQLLVEGMLVIVKEDGAPPLKWQMGRIIQLHPGTDGVARVAIVKTASGTLKRPVVKLCIVPNQSD